MGSPPGGYTPPAVRQPLVKPASVREREEQEQRQREAARRETAAREAETSLREERLRLEEARRQLEAERAAAAQEDADLKLAMALSLAESGSGAAASEDASAAAPAKRPLERLSDEDTIEKLIQILGIEDRDDEIDARYKCPLSLSVFRDPVTVAAGYHYERVAITAHLRVHDTDPVSNTVLDHKMVTKALELQREIKHSLQRELIEKIDFLGIDERVYQQLVPFPANVPATKVIFKLSVAPQQQMTHGSHN